MYKYQVDNQSTITPLLRNLMTGIPDLMASFENIANFNKDIRSVGTSLLAPGEGPGTS